MEYLTKGRRAMRTRAKRILAMLGIQRAHVQAYASISLHDNEDNVAESPLVYSHSRQIKTASLEAERKKAMGVAEIQRQRMRMP